MNKNRVISIVGLIVICFLTLHYSYAGSVTFLKEKLINYEQFFEDVFWGDYFSRIMYSVLIPILYISFLSLMLYPNEKMVFVYRYKRRRDYNSQIIRKSLKATILFDLIRMIAFLLYFVAEKINLRELGYAYWGLIAVRFIMEFLFCCQLLFIRCCLLSFLSNNKVMCIIPTVYIALYGISKVTNFSLIPASNMSSVAKFADGILIDFMPMIRMVLLTILIFCIFLSCAQKKEM